MIRLLAAVLSPYNPFFHSQTDWRIQTLVLPNRKYFTVLLLARILLPMPPPNTFRSGRTQPPKRERLGFSENFEAQGLGAHVARRAKTAAPRPRSTPLMSPRSFVSPRHKSHGDPRSRTGLQSGQAIVREGAQSPVIKVYRYIHICYISNKYMAPTKIKSELGARTKGAIRDSNH